MSGDICFHPRTEQIRIFHLMFADDVMISFDGTSNNHHGIAECLDDFASWSGMHMNANKTEIFTTCLNHLESTAISRYGFPIGTLPIRFLGLLLMSKKIKNLRICTKISQRMQR